MRGLPFRATTDDIYRVPRRSNLCHTAPTPGKTPGQACHPCYPPLLTRASRLGTIHRILSRAADQQVRFRLRVKVRLGLTLTLLPPLTLPPLPLPLTLTSNNGIVLGQRDGRATGEAWVTFTSPAEAQRAMSKNNTHLGSRYIELFAT